MPTYTFEAMDSTGQEIKDVIDAPSEEEAQATIRQMGYFVTKISVKKQRGGKTTVAEKKGGKKGGRSFALGGVSGKQLCAFTRQLSILQDAGLPILRSLKILEEQTLPGVFKNALLDTCEEIEGGSTLSEAMSKSPKAFDRLFVNMIKAGEAGGALEVILRRLAEFQEKAQTLKRKIKGALIYPVVVIMVAVAILAFIMVSIVPKFVKIFADFGTPLPTMTKMLMFFSNAVVDWWFLIPGIPIGTWLMVKMIRKFPMGRQGWDQFLLKMPVFGNLITMNILARTTRTLGTLVASGVPILEALTITRETCGNEPFENMYGKVTESIREGETIAKPMKENACFGYNIVSAFFWFIFIGGPLGILLYMRNVRGPIIDDLAINMIDVGEETGELDTMLNKIADNYDEQVSVLTESLVSLMEPLLIVFLGGAIGFIVISLFLPMIGLINSLSG